jgi:hypothetical protein
MFIKFLTPLAIVTLLLLTSCETSPQGGTTSTPPPESPAPSPAASVAAPQQEYVFKVNDASLLVGGKVTTQPIYKDVFGPGLDGTGLGGNRKARNELRYTCKDIVEGDYSLGMSVICGWYSYFGVGEGAEGQIELYRNDTRVLWTGEGEPLRPQNAAEKNNYQDQLRMDQPMHLKTGDVLRIVYDADGGGCTMGPIRLATAKTTGLPLPARILDTVRSIWLYADLSEPVRTPEKITQACTFTNPGVLPRTFTLQMQARDYLMAPLIPDQTETVTLSPGETVTRSYDFKPSTTGRDRFTLIANAPDVFPPLRRVKYFVCDRTEGPRPSVSLNGPDWDFCYAPGVEPTNAPPANAAWKKITVPSLQMTNEVLRKEGDKEITAEHHMGWYRKTINAPALSGERIMLKCGQIYSEAWFFLNGTQVAHRYHGSQPFEVDLTAGYKPGQPNELLVLVRDWLAYSPKNRERFAKGQPIAWRQDLIDLVDYPAVESIGIGSNISLEARPAVSVDDVFIVTSVREKKLSLKYRLINTTAQEQIVTLSPNVLDEGKEVNLFKPKQVTVGANQTAEVSFERGWSNPKLWWQDDPHLYVLQTTVQPAKGAADRHWERFGFREIWIDGGLFVLNGAKMKMKGCYGGSPMGAGSESWEPEKRLSDIWERQMDLVHDRGMQLGRSHLVRIKGEPVDVADETGAFCKVEGEFHQVAFTWDDNFWQAGLQRNVELVDIFKNHPSVIYWGAGNENMWGWIYLGEGPRKHASQWQLKICQAMRKFDLMKRPIDWEADGDLFGQWEQHSLHYPREFAVYPDLPNSAWIGPHDGKTVAMDYQFGPIILGKKPISLGESYWVSPQQPYAPTITIGDEAYQASNHRGKGWGAGIYFFVNGFRDAEFAYTDVLMFMPPLMKPQVVVPKEETTAFFSGHHVTRNFNVHNDVRYSAKFVLEWSLTPRDGGKPYLSDYKTLQLDPAELKRLSVDLNVPKVTQKTDALWHVELFTVKTVGTGLFPKTERQSVHVEDRIWQIYPTPALQSPLGPELSVYDPAGDTASALQKMGVTFTRLQDLGKPTGKALIIGKNVFVPNAQGAWQEALPNFVRAGGKILILGQKEAPDFLPVTMRLATGRKTTIAFVRAPDHPVMKGLADEDLRWWADDHNVADGNWQKPSKGRWMPLADVGTGDGLTQTPLAEEYDGKGSYLLCQMLVVDKALVSPPAQRMLQNMLDYLAAPAPFRTAGQTAVVAGLQSPLWKALSDSRLELANLTGRVGDLSSGKFDVAIVDVATALDDNSATALRTFAENGGKVLLHRAAPDKQAVLEKMLGIHLRFFPVANEPQDIQDHLLRVGNTGLMSGISNHELWWLGPKHLADVRQEGCWSSSYFEGCPPDERIADYYCWPGDDAGDKAVRLTRPGALIQVPAGKGYFVLNQLRFDQAIPEVQTLAERYRNLLLTNLGCTLGGDSDAAIARARRLGQYQFTPIDISAYCNRPLTDNKATGEAGWANQGENDMREFPTGKQTLAGVPFLIASPKSIITLYSVSADNRKQPKAVTGIKVGVKADALFFLHTAPYGGKHPFKYVVHYEDGTNLDIALTDNQEVYNWWSEPDKVADVMAQYGSFVAWKGQNPMTRAQGRAGVIMPGYEWHNPHPDKVIRDIDFTTIPDGDFGPVPILAAITAAAMQSDEGIVVDVINTRGIKVKLGDQVKEFCYIGLGGIEESHPYYAEAIKAHKALVVGQKVRIVYDLVKQNGAGQALAYVYLGSEIVPGALLNGKILAAGLSRLGDFESNSRLRTYLMNIGEPAKWRKVGMWSVEQK